VQYQAPWFRALAAEPGVELTVFYAMIPDADQQGVGFGLAFLWDIPLLDGYDYEVLRNVAARPSLSGFLGCDTPSIRRIVRERHFDAMILTGWHTMSSVQALRASRRAGVPCILRGESNALRPRRLLVRLVHRWLLRQYSAFLTIGKANERFYLDNGVAPHRLFPGRYCVDNDRLATEADRARLRWREIRAAWGVPEAAFVFLFCGKLIPKKRPMDLLHALARLEEVGQPRRHRVHVLMVGDGPMRGAIASLVKDRRLPVSMIGFLNQRDVAKAYSVSDCLVLPSDYGETWGLVVNEAMACGRPAIVSDRVGCHPDLVVPNETGFVYRCGDVEALAGRLGQLAASPGLAEALGRRARRHVQAYSFQGLVSGTLSATATVARRRDAFADPRHAVRPC
jgi:glycosyltransferase involved in cell wall biosynthesis